MTVNRIARLEREVQQMRQTLQQLSQSARPHPGKTFRIAKTTDGGGSYPTTGQQFQIEFLNIDFPDVVGNQVGTETVRANENPVCRNLFDSLPPVGTVLIAFEWRNKWFTHWCCGSSSAPSGELYIEAAIVVRSTSLDPSTAVWGFNPTGSSRHASTPINTQAAFGFALNQQEVRGVVAMAWDGPIPDSLPLQFAEFHTAGAGRQCALELHGTSGTVYSSPLSMFCESPNVGGSFNNFFTPSITQSTLFTPPLTASPGPPGSGTREPISQLSDLFDTWKANPTVVADPKVFEESGLVGIRPVFEFSIRFTADDPTETGHYWINEIGL